MKNQVLHTCYSSLLLAGSTRFFFWPINVMKILTTDKPSFYCASRCNENCYNEERKGFLSHVTNATTPFIGRSEAYDPHQSAHLSAVTGHVRSGYGCLCCGWCPTSYRT